MFVSMRHCLTCLRRHTFRARANIVSRPATVAASIPRTGFRAGSNIVTWTMATTAPRHASTTWYNTNRRCWHQGNAHRKRYRGNRHTCAALWTFPRLPHPSRQTFFMCNDRAHVTRLHILQEYDLFTDTAFKSVFGYSVEENALMFSTSQICKCCCRHGMWESFVLNTGVRWTIGDGTFIGVPPSIRM